MKRFLICSLMVLIAGMLCIGYVHATTFPTPSPYLGLTFGSDAESGIFSHGDPVLTIELLDVGDFIGTGSAFGFFFDGADVTNLNNLHTIFEIPDGPSLPTPTQIAVIDFNLGNVWDGDSGSLTPQNSFPLGNTANIGFWVYPIAGSGLPVLFTDPALNPAGTDVSGTFPITSTLGSDDYLITFEIPGVIDVLTAHFVGGITPVPEPSTILLLASGLGGLLIYKRRKMKQ